MPKLVFPVLPDGLLVDVVIGLDGATTTAQLAAGQPLTAPIRARGEIDTGTNVTAVSAASVPELTKRTISIDGKASQTSSANSTSRRVGAPKLVPSRAASVTASTTRGWACPRISGPQEPR